MIEKLGLVRPRGKHVALDLPNASFEVDKLAENGMRT